MVEWSKDLYVNPNHQTSLGERALLTATSLRHRLLMPAGEGCVCIAISELAKRFSLLTTLKLLLLMPLGFGGNSVSCALMSFTQMERQL